MEIEFDPKKDAVNIEKHGISLDRAIDLNWDGAFYREDTRYDYPERRFQVMAMLGEPPLHADHDADAERNSRNLIAQSQCK